MSNVKTFTPSYSERQLEEIAIIVDTVLASKHRDAVDRQREQIAHLEAKIKSLDRVINAQEGAIEYYKKAAPSQEELVNPTTEELDEIGVQHYPNVQWREFAPWCRITVLNLLLTFLLLCATATILYQLN